MHKISYFITKFWLQLSVAGMLLIALALRLGGITYGIPQDIFSDEFVHVATSFKMLADKTLRITFDLAYVPPLFAYILTPIFISVGAVGLLLGKFSGIADFQQYVIFNSENFLMYGRIVSALISTLFLYVLFIFTRRIFNSQIALATLFLAVFDFWILHESQLGHFWAPMLFFIITGFYSIWRVYETGTLRWYIISVLFIGLGFAIGYIPIILSLWLLFAHYWRTKRVQKYLIYSGGLLIFFLGLVSWLNPVSFFRQFGGAFKTAFEIFGIDIFPDLVSSGPSLGLIHNFKLLTQVLWFNNPFIFVAALLGFFFLIFLRPICKPPYLSCLCFPLCFCFMLLPQ